jgi:UDP-N-acetylmuramoyl-tripeptide--D-alanyl-D-alanine ligase
MGAETMMTLVQVAEATGGTIVRGSPDAAICAVGTDSRAVLPGALFVALQGEKFDGHDFVNDAVKAGAAAVLAHHPLPAPLAIATVQVDDTRLALGRLAAWWRARWQGKLVALTGSNGKTTVKEMIAAILRAHTGSEDAVLATQGNLNNDIGMPLTLLRLRPMHSHAVIEMGMNHLGEIDYLTRIARPHVALVNNAQRAHVGELGDMNKVAQAKGEIYAGLANDGVAIVNADDAFADYWRGLNAGRRQMSFGLMHGDVRAASVGDQVCMATPAGEVVTRLQVPGEHNLRNAAAACAAALALGVSAETIAAGLAQYPGVKGRLQRKRGANGATVIDDTYNANPDSMAAALGVLAASQGKKLFVTGDMGELGAQAPGLHAEVGAFAIRCGIDALYGLGEHTARTVDAFGNGARHFATVDALVEALRPELAPDVTVLVKGSRFMRMERIVDAIVAQQE